MSARLPRVLWLLLGVCQVLLAAPADTPDGGHAGQLAEQAGADPRRATAVNVQFEVAEVPNSNLLEEPRSSTNVNVRAGVMYQGFKIYATTGLGLNEDTIRAKLVPYDLQATGSTCPEVAASMGPPFDGSLDSALSDGKRFSGSPDETLNVFTDVAFPHAGKFRLCYTKDGTLWEELEPGITVLGAEESNNKFWCAFQTLQNMECFNQAVKPAGCECKGKVLGYKLSDSGDALTQIGLPSPNVPPWRVQLVNVDEECGEGVLTNTPFATNYDQGTYVEITNEPGFEIHNLGLIFARDNPRESLNTWKICYCAGFSHDNLNAPCHRPLPNNPTLNFPQEIGRLITISVLPGKEGMTVYPTIRFNLIINCGSSKALSVGNDLAPGGCAATDEVRYKIVRKTPEVDLLYYDPAGGCKFLSQAATEIDGERTYGGHVGPPNCVDAVTCRDMPEALGPKNPTWNEIQVDATYDNGVMIAADFDVCYCDGDCLNSMNWFQAGFFEVRPVRMEFTDRDFNGLDIGSLVVNTGAHVEVRGQLSAESGNWSTAATGSMTREMKILADPAGNIDKDACLNQAQPDSVTGHQLISGNTDYTDPTTLDNGDPTKPTGQRYGSVCDMTGANCIPNIRISQAGWYAVCYCDSNCNEITNWAVFGRALVAGPHAGQVWTVYAGVTFHLDIDGYALDGNNRILVLSFNNDLSDCGNVNTPDEVTHGHGTEKLPSLLDSTTRNAKITSMVWDPVGTRISFARSHGLKDGDYIEIQGTNGGSAAVDEAYGTTHEVFVACDDPVTQCFEIMIGIRYPAAEFPSLGVDSVTWKRNSVERFDGLKVEWGFPSPDGRGYIVCWSSVPENHNLWNPNGYIGQAGTLIVRDAIQMPVAKLGLTTVEPEADLGNGAPVIVAWETGSNIARYEEAEGQMQVIISIQPGFRNGEWIDVLDLRKADNSELLPDSDFETPAQANQAFCGRVILEMWSSDLDGFPMPAGCFYTEDTTQQVPPKREKRLHILFSPRNHLKKDTRYMVVLNMNIVKENQESNRVIAGGARGSTTAKFPDQGAVWIWSMDDVHERPYDVVELGRADLAPAERSPPRSENGDLLLSGLGDPQFNEEEGFKLISDSNEEVHRLKAYCLNQDYNLPLTTPTVDFACKECFTEEDCGNGDAALGIPPNPLLTWCRSPLDITCPASNGDEMAVPSFKFQLRAKVGYPIQGNDFLRIFLHPLTAWDISQSCIVAWETGSVSGCPPPEGGGSCGNPRCDSEAVVHGMMAGEPPMYPINTLKITFPIIMGKIQDTIKGTIDVGGLTVPPGGFFPESLSAELMKAGEQSPNYWPRRKVPGGGAKLFRQPRILAASLVTKLGDGNAMAFRGDPRNSLYVRIVMGATLLSKANNDVSLDFLLPTGYMCNSHSNNPTVPDLQVLEGKFPSSKGTFGLSSQNEVSYSNEDQPQQLCRIAFKQNMVLFAGTVAFAEIRVDNPSNVLKSDSPLNVWRLTVENTGSYQMHAVKLSDQQLRPCEADGPRKKFLCHSYIGEGFGGNVSVLGKLSDQLISPSQFGVSEMNTMIIFFKTEQEVGSLMNLEAQVWVQAPPGFDFGMYCSAGQLDSSYYIPEAPFPTERVPSGPVMRCTGGVTDSSQITYNVAKIRTTGRLLSQTFYGFKVMVRNANKYLRLQQEGWLIWTYDGSGNGVDGSHQTAKYNEKDPIYHSWGLYQKSLPHDNFGVRFGDLRPTPPGYAPTEITVMPIIVTMPMNRAMRVIAPAGYQWDFEQYEFRFKARAVGVLESQIVDGIEADLPISGTPARPISEPRNALTVDYMQGTWVPNIIYGFACKIRVPVLPPTASANVFTIEFGYNEDIHANRLEAGMTSAQLVKRIINGQVDFTTSIKNRTTVLTFTMRTVTKIPAGGGIQILGPKNFEFAEHCQPKPANGFPELPYDTTCHFEPNISTGEPIVSITAGPMGIEPRLYSFTLDARNPPQEVLPANAGTWMFNSYDLMVDKSMLDFPTVVDGFAVGIEMLNASLVMHPKKSSAEAGQPGCFRTTAEEQALGAPVTYCDFEHWQFYPDLGGGRDDRPGARSQLIIKMQLTTEGAGTDPIVVRAPVGYQFDTDCQVATYPSSLIFDKFATEEMITLGRATWVTGMDAPFQSIPNDDKVSLDETLPGLSASRRQYNQRFDPWPKNSGIFQGCSGRNNIARIFISQGLLPGKSYLFRLEVLKNPMFTPAYNYFILEYNGEASMPFPGIPIWAFSNLLITPTTYAASTSSVPTPNLVTIQIEPLNMIPNGGHLRITAPAEFLVATNCEFTLRVHPDDMPNMTALPPGEQEQVMMRRWSEFLPGDVQCQGDESPSSRARIKMVNNGKYMKPNIRYIIELHVINPQTTTATPDPWVFESFATMFVNELLDSSSWPGFVINSAVRDFAYVTPSSYNALADQLLDFTMTFPENVVIGDRIEIVAPVTCFFSRPGSNECPGYRYMEGSLSRTTPTCGANTITWALEEESIPAYAPIRFMIGMINPPSTPYPNLFNIRQVASTGRWKTSRMIDGFEIVPELNGPAVTLATAPPLKQCRTFTDVITNMPCQGYGSNFAVLITFTPTQTGQLIMVRASVAHSASEIQGAARVDDDDNDESFDFLSAKIYDTVDVATGANRLDASARSKTAIVFPKDTYVGETVTFRVDDILSPQREGYALFSLTTLSTVENSVGLVTTTSIEPPLPCLRAGGPCGQMPYPGQRRDETLLLQGPRVLGYLDILISSNVNPIFYNEPSATVTFEIEVGFTMIRTDILRVTRPEGYRFIDNSLVTFRGLRMGEHGVDGMRLFSTNVTAPEDYFMVLETEAGISRGSKLLFSVRAALPPVAFPDKFWFFRTYRVLPVRDVDGEILNASQVPYPFIGRALEQTGTNDGAYPGFLLVDEVPFTATPQLNTPGALIKLTFNFNVRSVIQARTDIRVEISGPEGFVFTDSCFYTINTPIGSTFAKCTGFRNTATLVTLRNELRGADITANLEVTNPPKTPDFNYWRVAIFPDDSNQYVSFYQTLSYEIIGMPVTYRGNNQLGESASGFFTFSPVRAANSEILYIVLTPPPKAGYRIFCTGMSPLGFVKMPTCTSGQANDPVKLKWDNMTLVAGTSYTLGVMVYNPGGKPADSANFWGIALKDGNQDTFDANLNVQGLVLRSMPMRCHGLGWSTAAPRVLGAVLIQIRVLHSIPAGIASHFQVRAPEGIMYSEDLNAVKVIPAPLPLKIGNPTSIAGDVLYLYLDENRDIMPALYNIRFEVSNPGRYPNDNTWSVELMKGNEVLFSHMMAGYVQGQVSPFDLTTASTFVSGSRRAGEVGLAVAWCTILGLAASFQASRRTHL